MAWVASLILFLHFGSIYGYNLKERDFEVTEMNGGNALPIQDAPYMALYRPGNQLVYCGASIISEKFVVTAAHCIKPKRWYMYVTVGTDELHEGQQYEIEDTFIHPNYVERTFSSENDIALIKLKKSLSFNDRVRPIKLADPDLRLDDNDKLTALGFGSTECGRLSSKLLSVTIPYVNQILCQMLYGMRPNRFEATVTDTMLCTGFVVPNETCQGDSGGPLVFNNTLVGVTSWGKGCEGLGYPDVSTRISAFRSFIDDTSKKNSS